MKDRKEKINYGDGLYGSNNPIDFDYYLNEENIDATSAALKSSFIDFLYFMFRAVEKEEFVLKSFHKEVCKKLETIAFGENERKNLIINIPPRSGKSAITQYFCAYSLALNPKSNFVTVCYEETITNKMSSNILKIIMHPIYQKLFGLKLKSNTQAKALWETEDGGTYRAAPMGSAITGFGAGVAGDEFGGALVIDDPMNTIFFNSEAKQKEVWDIYVNSLKKRLNNLSRTPIVIIMQRICKNDLVDMILKNEPEDWDIVKVPAIYEKDGKEFSFWEKKFPLEELKKERRDHNFTFQAQMQQEPIVLGGEMVKSEWFTFYDSLPSRFKKLFMTADTAFKTNEWNDYTALGLWGISMDNKLYLIDMLHKKINAADLDEQFRIFWNKWNGGVLGRRISALYIEDKASGMQLIQSLRKDSGIPVLAYKIGMTDKMQRIADMTPHIQSGNVKLPVDKMHPLSKEVINELTSLCADGTHKHDDIADCMSMATHIGFRPSGII